MGRMTNALNTRRLLAVVVMVFVATEVRAQFVVPVPVVVGNSGSGVLVTRPGRHTTLAFGAVNVGPTLYGSPFFGSYPGISQVTVIYSTPPVQPAPMPVVAAGPRVLRLDDLPLLDPSLRSDPIPDRVPPPRPAEPVAPPLPGGRDAGVFRPLEPDNRDRANRPGVPAPPPPPAPPAPQGPRPFDVDLPRPPMPEADPKTESGRLIALGRVAFAAREYGRAAQRFREAVKLTPADEMPYFLLGQALFAAGRYPEAVAAIRVGVQLRPDWPMVRFPPRELYGINAVDFEDQQRRLRQSLEEFRNDSELLFLLGYELWFDGKADEGRALFLKARPGAADPAVIDRFLAARPAA
jgi:Tetratricopeptide repeat